MNELKCNNCKEREECSELNKIACDELDKCNIGLDCQDCLVCEIKLE